MLLVVEGGRPTEVPSVLTLYMYTCSTKLFGPRAYSQKPSRKSNYFPNKAVIRLVAQITNTTARDTTEQTSNHHGENVRSLAPIVPYHATLCVV